MKFLNRNILLIIGLITLAAVIYYFADIVTYILIALVLYMLGRPLVVFYQKHLAIGRFRMGHSGAAILTILTFYLMLAGVLLLFIPTIVSQARHLATVDYQVLGEKIRPFFFNVDLQLHQIGLLDPGESLALETQKALTNWFQPALVGNFIGKFLGVAGNIAVTFASVTFILFFFLQDNQLLPRVLHAIVPDNLEKKVHSALHDSSELLTRYFRGLLIQLLVFSALSTLILWILGVPNAVLIGSFGGLFNIIPYIGPVLGMVFGAFITVSSGLDADLALILPQILKVAATFAVVQVIDNNIVGPIIMSKSVQAHPLEIFLVILAAAQIGGVVGMIIGVPVFTVLRVIARTFFSEFKLMQRMASE